MRLITTLFGLVVFAAGGDAETKKKATASPVRYGISPDLQMYPQNTARGAFSSILKAIEGKRIDYLLAQLTDPAFVDERVKRLFGGKFAEQVAETRDKLDEATVKQLHRFQEKGDWAETEGRTVVTLKDLPDRAVYLKKIGPRWYLENQNKAEKVGK